MREILFRGKRFDNGEWVYWDRYGRITDVNGEPTKTEIDIPTLLPYPTYISDLPIINDETVGQYTGLTDKNGKKIFEGDIVKDEGFAYRLLGDNRKVNRNGIAVVEYGFHDVPSEDPFEWGEAYGFYFNGDTLYPTPARYKPYCEGKGKQFSIEVIGNKWDNPELLEVER